MIAWVGDAELQAIKRRTKARLDRARAQGKTLQRPWSAHTGFIFRFTRVKVEGGKRTFTTGSGSRPVAPLR